MGFIAILWVATLVFDVRVLIEEQSPSEVYSKCMETKKNQYCYKDAWRCKYISGRKIVSKGFKVGFYDSCPNVLFGPKGGYSY